MFLEKVFPYISFNEQNFDVVQVTPSKFQSVRAVVFKLFVVVSHLEVCDLTAAHQEPLYQTYS